MVTRTASISSCMSAKSEQLKKLPPADIQLIAVRMDNILRNRFPSNQQFHSVAVDLFFENIKQDFVYGSLSPCISGRGSINTSCEDILRYAKVFQKYISFQNTLQNYKMQLSIEGEQVPIFVVTESDGKTQLSQNKFSLGDLRVVQPK